MSLITQLNTLVTRIGTEFKAVRAKLGSNDDLATTAKSTLVAAINEVAGAVAGAGATIDDDNVSTLTVYSSSKTVDVVNAAIDGLVDGAPGALDTLKEIADQLADDEDAVAALTTALGNRVRFDAAQSLNGTQQAQAATNLGMLLATEIGDPATDFVAVFEAALA